MRRLLLIFILIVLGPFSASLAAQDVNGAAGATEFLDARDVFKVELSTASPATRTAARLSARIAPGYYVYRHRLKVEVGGKVLPLSLPAGQQKTDEFFGTTQVYRDGVAFDIPATEAREATLHWQGCADAGICYPPQTLRLVLPDASSARSQTVAPNRPVTPPTASPLAADEALARRLADSGAIVAVTVFFAMGLLLAFTPCTLPMVPIVSSLVLGGRPSPRRALALSVSYVFAMAGAYAVLGVVAGMSGANVQATLQHPWLLMGFAVLFVVLAMAMFGAFELQMPDGLRNRLDRVGRGQAGGKLPGAAAMGLLSALLVGPCMTAPLAGALLYIGQSGDPVTGGMALFALGMGMGIPLLLIAVFGARALPKPGPWMQRVKAGFGFVLLAMAVTMAGRVLPGPMTLALWGAWFLAVSVALMAMASTLREAVLGRWVPRWAAAILAVWAVAMMLGGAAGATDPWRPLQVLAGRDAPAAAPNGTTAFVTAKSTEDVARLTAMAGAEGRWTLVDFYADWCISCHVIEQEVFGDRRVAAVLAQMVVVRPDVTANDATDQALMREWQVAGPPTLLLIGPDGRERRNLRMVGELGAEEFLQALRAAGVEAG